MSADGGEADGFVARVSAAFARDVFQPMFQRASSHPADVRQLIAECRRKLDALDVVIASCPDPTAPQQRDASFRSNGADHGEGNGASSDDYDDIGRNQRSRLRELTLLEALARETRPYSLQQLLAALVQKGFDDTSAAVVSQLHRLKKGEVVNQPANGMYEITDTGLGHLRKLRQSFGPLMGG